MIDIDFNDDNVTSFVSRNEIDSLQAKITLLHANLEDGIGKGNDYTGWLHLPSQTPN